MCVALDSILADKQTHDARDAFSPVFEQLLTTKTLRSNGIEPHCPHSKQLASRLSQVTLSYAEHLSTLPKHDTYSRHIIGAQDNWIGFICRWEKNVTSTIHGHPSFAYYQVLDGRIVMDMFEPVNETEAQHVSTCEMLPGDCIFSITREGQFDNLIHRVRTENSTVFTLHLYSDNPAKGRIFKAV